MDNDNRTQKDRYEDRYTWYAHTLNNVTNVNNNTCTSHYCYIIPPQIPLSPS